MGIFAGIALAGCFSQGASSEIRKDPLVFFGTSDLCPLQLAVIEAVGTDVADRPSDAGFQDNRRFTARTTGLQSARPADSSWCCAVGSICSQMQSLRLTAQSPRR